MIEHLFANLLVQYSYAVLIPTSVVAQPAIALLAGVFVKLGHLVFPLAFVCIVTGALIGDVIWYWIGYHYGEKFAKRYGKYLGLTEEHIASTKKIFHAHQGRILFLSKITNGLGLAIVTLFTAGLSRIPFSRYLVFNLVGEAVWTGTLMIVGIFFSHLYVQVGSTLEKVSVVGFFLICVILFYGFARFVQSLLVRNDTQS